MTSTKGACLLQDALQRAGPQLLQARDALQGRCAVLVRSGHSCCCFRCYPCTFLVELGGPTSRSRLWRSSGSRAICLGEAAAGTIGIRLPAAEVLCSLRAPVWHVRCSEGPVVSLHATQVY